MGREARVTRRSGGRPGRGPRLATIPRAILGTRDRAVNERDPASPCSQELSLEWDVTG